MITDHDIINRILENQQRCVDQVVNVHEKILTYLQEDRRRSSNNNQYQRTSEGSNIHKRSHVNMQLEEQEFERLSKASKERNQDNRLSAGSKRNYKDCDHVKDNDKVYTPPIQSNRNRIYPNKRLFDVQNRQEQSIKKVYIFISTIFLIIYPLFLIFIRSISSSQFLKKPKLNTNW